MNYIYMSRTRSSSRSRSRPRSRSSSRRNLEHIEPVQSIYEQNEGAPRNQTAQPIHKSPNTHYYGHGLIYREYTLKLIHKIMEQLKYIYKINTNFSSIDGDNKSKKDALYRLQIDTKIEMQNAKKEIEDIQNYLKSTLVDSNVSNNGASLNLTDALKLKIKKSIDEFEKNKQNMSEKEKSEHAREIKQLSKNVSFLDSADEFLKLPHDSWKTGISSTNVVNKQKTARINADLKRELYYKYIGIIGDKEILSRKNGISRNSEQAKNYKNYKQEFSELNPTYNNVTRYRARRFLHTLKHFKNSNEYKNYMMKSGWGANL
jgi:hypothetical protein